MLAVLEGSEDGTITALPLELGDHVGDGTAGKVVLGDLDVQRPAHGQLEVFERLEFLAREQEGVLAVGNLAEVEHPCCGFVRLGKGRRR